MPLSAPTSEVSPEGKLELSDASKECKEKPSGKYYCTCILWNLDFHLRPVCLIFNRVCEF